MKELFLFEIVMINSGEEFVDTNGIIRICISKDRQRHGQKKKYKRTNKIYKRLHRKLKIEQNKPPKKRG